MAFQTPRGPPTQRPGGPKPPENRSRDGIDCLIACRSETVGARIADARCGTVSFWAPKIRLAARVFLRAERSARPTGRKKTDLIVSRRQSAVEAIYDDPRFKQLIAKADARAW